MPYATDVIVFGQIKERPTLESTDDYVVWDETQKCVVAIEGADGSVVSARYHARLLNQQSGTVRRFRHVHRQSLITHFGAIYRERPSTKRTPPVAM